ncbi:MAG: rhodanese-like domain-containing protein [Flavobacteriales bacterium]|nr:rhodanese-like domain-containing protein [Flavobacteriales bacterium]
MKEISASELKSWMDQGRDFLIIDIREPFEYEWSNLGGLNIPMGNVIDEKKQIPTHKEVVIHCNTGARAAALIDVLETLHGFSNLINLAGGIEAFAEVVDASKQPYK